ncbi:MAG: FKBP-type peptidyl-prolyl cis-trans isomerase, partial [Propionicimonas sp.]
MLSRLPLVLATTAAALLLTACGSGTPASVSASPSASPSGSAPASTTPTPTPSVAVSTSLDAIKVSGPRLQAPKVTFKAPFAIDQTRTRVEVAGNGPKAVETGYVTVHYYGVNGRTGKSFDESYSRKQTITFRLDQVIEGFKKGLTGQAAGSRVLIVMPGSDGYDASGGTSDGSIAVGDTLIFVVDVVKVSLTEPSGRAITPAAGLPTVTPGTGKPTITIPAGAAAPTKMVAQTLIEGTGAKVAKADTILARYVG